MLEVTGLTRAHGHGPAARPALDGITFTADRGEITAVTGPSGCGKSTLLRCAAGLLRPSSGQVTIDGTPVAGVPGRLAVVFQDYGRSPYPWLTVADNIALPLRRRLPSSRDRRAAAIARALAADPLLLMDEPHHTDRGSRPLSRCGLPASPDPHQHCSPASGSAPGH